MGQSNRVASHGRVAGVNSKLRFETDVRHSLVVGAPSPPGRILPVAQPGPESRWKKRSCVSCRTISSIEAGRSAGFFAII